MAYASFCVKNIFAVVHLYMSHQSAKIGFPVQTGLGVWLGFKTYYFFKSDEDLTSSELMLRFEIS